MQDDDKNWHERLRNLVRAARYGLTLREVDCLLEWTNKALADLEAKDARIKELAEAHDCQTARLKVNIEILEAVNVSRRKVEAKLEVKEAEIERLNNVVTNISQDFDDKEAELGAADEEIENLKGNWRSNASSWLIDNPRCTCIVVGTEQVGYEDCPWCSAPLEVWLGAALAELEAKEDKEAENRRLRVENERLRRLEERVKNSRNPESTFNW